MNKQMISKIIKYLFYILIINIIFSLFLYYWATDNDININKSGYSRFIDILYYSISTFTTTGYGDIYAKSNRMKIIISSYMIFISSVYYKLIL
jgi:hypothetical protein